MKRMTVSNKFDDSDPYNIILFKCLVWELWHMKCVRWNLTLQSISLLPFCTWPCPNKVLHTTSEQRTFEEETYIIQTKGAIVFLAKTWPRSVHHFYGASIQDTGLWEAGKSLKQGVATSRNQKRRLDASILHSWWWHWPMWRCGLTWNWSM